MKTFSNIPRTFFLFVVATTIISCGGSADNTNNKLATSDKTASRPVEENFEELYDSTTKSIPIFYNMYLTVEMASMFRNVNAAFDVSTLNPTNNIIKYETSSKKALNLGVYAVDLSYTKVFEQYEKSSAYFTAMHNLAAELGIPDNFFYDAAIRFDKNLTNKDSLGKIANEVYVTTEKHLKENDQDNNASLVVLGGWIEALYLASELYLNYDKSVEILDRIVEQKNSLEEIIKLLSPYKDEKIVADYLNKLADLRFPFNNVKVDYERPDISDDEFKILANQISTFRTNIVNN